MAIGEQDLDKTSWNPIEIVKRVATAPIRHYRAEKLRSEQATALLARTDLTLKDIPAIAELAKSNNSMRAVEMVTLMEDVVTRELR